jgi:hypothetical protein
MLMVAPRCAALEFQLKSLRGPTLGRMPYPRIFQIQLAFDAPPGVVTDLIAVIKIRDAGPFGIHELQLQRSIGV